MKTPDEVVRRIQRRLKDTWTATVLAEAAGSASTDAWPHAFPLGKKPSSEIARNFGEHFRSVHAWRDWAQANQVSLHEARRLIDGSQQQAATHVVVPNIDTAAAIAGAEWSNRIAVGRTRAADLRKLFPDTTPAEDRATHALLRDATQLAHLDFEILCEVADWFRRTPRADRAGLTPRQVPIEGVHAKWLNANQALVRTLAGIDDLDLAPAHPARIHFTYLDPDYLDTGGRQHDSYSVGDVVALPYEPTVVLISENKDTAIGFPRTPGGIAVEGAGAGGGTIASISWIRDADLVVYWGDMDIDGLEILNDFRASGVTAASMFMDRHTYDDYCRYGTNYDRHGKPLNVRPPRVLPHLERNELDLYTHLTSGSAPALRVEQERIPLGVAAAHLARLPSGVASRQQQRADADVSVW